MNPANEHVQLPNLVRGTMHSMDTCNECGFVYATVEPGSVVGRLKSFETRFAAALDNPSELLHTRPRPDVWSAVEYACHVRDTFLSQRERLYLTLAVDVPAFSPMYRDLRVEFAHYNAEPAPRVIEELAFAARLIGDAFAGLEDHQWSRTCIYNYPTSAERSVAWLGQHTVHEAEHHLMDVTRGLQELRQR
jgi:isopenicillin N synthase-like dioxygenase